jgi:hypothetical protein
MLLQFQLALQVRYSYLLGTLLAGGHHFLAVGETGERGGWLVG